MSTRHAPSFSWRAFTSFAVALVEGGGWGRRSVQNIRAPLGVPVGDALARPRVQGIAGAKASPARSAPEGDRSRCVRDRPATVAAPAARGGRHATMAHHGDAPRPHPPAARP